MITALRSRLRLDVQYVDVDAQTLREAIARTEAEMVSHWTPARVEQTHRTFWREVDARTASSGPQPPSGPVPDAAQG